MDVGSWYKLEFLVAPDRERLAAEAEGRPTTDPTPIYITPVMRVTLLPDENFKVVPQTPAEQPLGFDKSASWKWNVSPVTKQGTFTLVAQVQVLRDGEPIDNYTRRVDVRVTVGTWQAFLSALRNAATLGDALTTLFRSWEKTFGALGALITAVLLLLWRLGIIKKRPEKAGA